MAYRNLTYKIVLVTAVNSSKPHQNGDAVNTMHNVKEAIFI